MPQMAPLSWMNLFVLFIATFMILNTLNYFSFTYQTAQSSKTPKMKTFNWKW